MLDLGRLYESYARDVHRFALFLSGDAALAEDITSETFLRAWHASDRIRTETVKAYLFTIARNVFLQEVRRSGRHVALTDGLPAGVPDPQASVEASAGFDALIDALRRLSESDRTALLMRCQHDLPYEEIARTLGISVAAAKVRVHRARLRLASLMPQEFLP